MVLSSHVLLGEPYSRRETIQHNKRVRWRRLLKKRWADWEEEAASWFFNVLQEDILIPSGK